MFLLHGDGKYIDMFERVLYNGVLSGVSLAGNTFFYQNPLESNGRAKRAGVFRGRLLPGESRQDARAAAGAGLRANRRPLDRARGRHDLRHLYVGNHAEVKVGNRRVKIVEDTRYPWDGRRLAPARAEGSGAFTIALRIPGWSRDAPVSSDLYASPTAPARSHRCRCAAATRSRRRCRSTCATATSASAQLEARRYDSPHPADARAPHRRARRVKDDEGRTAIQRVRWSTPSRRSTTAATRSIWCCRAPPRCARASVRNLLNGVEVISGEGSRPFVAIPYYAWNNRGQGEMAVWIKEKE